MASDTSVETRGTPIRFDPASPSSISRQIFTVPAARALTLRTICRTGMHWQRERGFSALRANPTSPECYPIRILWPVGSSCFNHLFHRNGTKIREHALGLLSAPTLAEAESHAKALSKLPCTMPQRRILGAVYDMALKKPAGGLLWNHAEFIDALRMRHIRSKLFTQRSRLLEVSDLEWAGSLHWLGNQISGIHAEIVDEKTRRIATTAVASVAGYRSAIAFLFSVKPKNVPTTAEEFRWHSACALRAVLDGGVIPEVASCLIPPSSSGNLCQSDSAWLPFKLCISFIVERQQTDALVLILAELLSSSFRNRLAFRQRRLFFSRPCLLPFDIAWTDTEFAEAKSILQIVSSMNWNPWEQEYARLFQKHTAVDLLAIDGHIRKLLHGRISILPYVYMNRSLLTSALFAIVGNDVSARTALAACGASEIWTAPCKTLYDSINLSMAHTDPGSYLSSHQLADPDLQSLLMQIRETVEPNIALGTPIWSVADSLSKWAVRLTGSGRMVLFRQLRTLLTRSDLCERLDRWMMLTTENRASYESFFINLSQKLQQKSEDFWRDAFDDIAENYSNG